MSATTIAEYIRRTASRPFAWGEMDCALWAADLVRARTGFDPARDFRGTYCTAFACRKAVMRRGGLETVIRLAMAAFPAGERTDGVALARVDGRAVCGVLSGGRFWIKAGAGVRAPGSARIIEGWTI